jgi:bla regulator protein blaR1
MRLLRATVVCVGLLFPAAAQPPAFEVTSVKPNLSEDFRGMGIKTEPNGRLTATNLPVRMLISMAYGVPNNPTERLVGVPDWVLRDRFDIEATAPEGAFPQGIPTSEARARMLAMVQALLADRFKLAMRHETKELPVYELTVAKGGPKLEKSTLEEKDCPIGPSSSVTCHNFNGGMGRGLHAKAASMQDLARFIENWTDLPVIDRTGLTGLFAMETEGWMPMRLPPPPPPSAGSINPAPRPSGDGDMSDPARPTIFMVLQKLGLDLKRQRGPVDVYTIEHIERPAAN